MGFFDSTSSSDTESASAGSTNARTQAVTSQMRAAHHEEAAAGRGQRGDALGHVVEGAGSVHVGPGLRDGGSMAPARGGDNVLATPSRGGQGSAEPARGAA